MRVVFWGTPAFAVPSLRALTEEGHEVVGVVTQPSRPAGRRRTTHPSPVQKEAEAEGLVVLAPDRPRGAEFTEALGNLNGELSVVVAYGHILRKEVLELPPLGSINVHASLLPELRGAAPIHWAIARGHDRTGVTAMRMVEAMDAGPILLRVEEPISPTETSSELASRLAELGAQALVETLALLTVGGLEEREQDEALATYAPKVTRDTARVSWNETASNIANLIRAMDRKPGAWTLYGDEPLKLFVPEVVELEPVETEPGTVIEASEHASIVVATGEGAVRVGEVQPAGRRRMATTDWMLGSRVREGQHFE